MKPKLKKEKVKLPLFAGDMIFLKTPLEKYETASINSV